MKKLLAPLFGLFLTLIFCTQAFAAEEVQGEALSSFEEDDGFGFDSDEGANKKDFSVTAGGKLSTGISLFFDEFKNFQSVRPSSLIWGNLFLEAKSPVAEALIKLNLSDRTLSSALKQKAEIFPQPLIPMWIEQAYVQAAVSGFVLGGGIKKINWGRADELSVLDVVNPQDLTDFSVLNAEERKIAQPMFYFSAYMPHETKLEAVFIPLFEPNRTAITGRWQHPMAEKQDSKNGGALKRFSKADTAKLKYAHGGARFTATVGGLHDIGFQYFYGYLFTPAVNLRNTEISYTPYHQIGADYATAVGPFNLRTEFAANITHDIDGTKENLHNPQIAWNAGFDYTMPHKFVLGLLFAETIRLYQRAITGVFDTEAGENAVDTVFMISLSQRFLRGGAEWKLAGYIGLENADFLITPGVNFILGSILIDVNMGFFGGKNPKGRFARYSKNHYMKVSMGYSF